MPAIAAHHTATVDEAWDGPAAVAAMPNEQGPLTYCHGWYEADADRSEKGTYKFPMHKTDGGPANVRACRNALARVANSSIPDGDKAGVRRHAQTHLDDANKKSGNSARFLLPAGAFNVIRRLHAANDGGTQRPWYRLTLNDTGGSSTLFVFGPIGGWFGVNSEDFAAELAQVRGPLNVHINSGGGSAYEGISIANLLRQHPHSVNGIVTGLAASAASVIAMGCDSLTMAPGSQLMIHRAMTDVYGNRDDMAEAIDFLEKMDTSLAGLYQDRAGGDLDQWENAMQAETWYTPQEAVDAGLADHIAEPPDKAGDDTPNGWNSTVRAEAAVEPVVVEPVETEPAADTGVDDAASPPVTPAPAQSSIDPAAAVAALRGAFATPEGGAA